MEVWKISTFAENDILYEHILSVNFHARKFNRLCCCFDLNGAKLRSLRIATLVHLENKDLVAKIVVDRAENEPSAFDGSEAEKSEYDSVSNLRSRYRWLFLPVRWEGLEYFGRFPGAART